ncbi:hypothetical protein HYALB_00008432 [Hymenoscyphus albidus]|uniref:Uncharacterized protein n=1 Tax=Hymenoscyphus albidus TaxID=595503 RepID=A0A9N9LKC3_9HELO|nr:hypothetical protein HYALB_00008432 [Hymenoscyphus albidus]
MLHRSEMSLQWYNGHVVIPTEKTLAEGSEGADNEMMNTTRDKKGGARAFRQLSEPQAGKLLKKT